MNFTKFKTEFELKMIGLKYSDSTVRVYLVKIIDGMANLKHRLILSLLYGCGLRLGEVINLRLTDIDRKRMAINIKAAKGKKDRVVMLSPKLLGLAEIYYRAYRPAVWLLNGQDGGQYSRRSVQNVVKAAAKCNPHLLRHCFATHLVEAGTDLVHVKNLLGHSNIKTTMVYTHVSNRHLSNIKSPLG